MDDKFIEKYYETVILPLYGDAVTFSKITWKDHGRVGLDAWGHYFDDQNGREYVLIYEDFPGSEYLNDNLTHEVVRCGDEISVQITTTPKSTVDNITGYFTLYAEKQ